MINLNNEKRKKESSLILRKAKFQAIFKFVLSSASGGAGGGKYKRISAFVSMPVLLIRSSIEKFFKKNFRDDRLFLGFAKMLALIFTLATTAESRADEETPVCTGHHGKEVTCIDKLTDENGNNSCGDNCSYRVVNENGQQVLHIYKTDISKSASICKGAFSPSYYADNQVKDAQNKVIPLQNIVFDNDFENIGAYAFAGSGAQISTASGKFIVNKTGEYALYSGSNGIVTMNADVLFNNTGNYVFEGSNINGDVIISDGVTEMGIYALGRTRIDGNIIIPQSVEKIHLDSLLLNLTGQIYCASGIENCYNMIIAGCSEKEGRTECFNSAQNLLDSNKFSAYPDGCEKLEANLKCTKCKSASFKLEDDGWCLRKIYTPAEAAEVLKNDNTNSVTITFKK